MRRLEWTETDERWHARRYFLELVAPGLWVATMSRRLQPDRPRIVMTSGSLRALKASLEEIERRRRALWRMVTYLVGMSLALVGAWWASSWGHEASPMLILIFSGLALFCLLGGLDAAVRRSWEWISADYQ